MNTETTALVEREAHTYRLPRTVVPEKYEITLAPDLNEFKFTGEETIHLSVKESVTEILLNALDLEIDHASANDKSGRSLSGRVSLDASSERATITFAEPLGPGHWDLQLKFTGTLNDKLHGFYRSAYKDASGKDKILATTQFEATDARRAFPCWDEPDFKAVFKITLVVDEKLTAISNAGIQSEKALPQGKKEVAFKDTIKMSTYLVAFIVGEFEGTDAVEVDGAPIRVWSVPGKKHLAKFAQDCAVACFKFFSKYYGIKYPGDKCDFIAIPDFASGAMENLGAITFRETALLVDEKAASHAELERVADVVAHEIAHMWFGDLVTMKWWNGLWLNEAFATFMEMLAVDNWKPEWKRWDTFGVSRAAAFAVDGLQSTRTIEFPVKHPDDAAAMFDILTYEKGASVLRMLEQYLGGEKFRQGISHYLHKHEFDNAETTDLWDAIEETSKEPVRQLMDSWIFQGGYPMVTVDLNADKKSVTLAQQRFFYKSAGAEKGQLFQVPVMLKAGTDKGTITKRILLRSEKESIDLPAKVNWLVVNEGGHGFYRVRYSSELLECLTSQLWSTLTPIERFGLVSDTWACVVAGLSPLEHYTRMTSLFANETDKNVWAILIGSLTYLHRAIDEKDRPSFEKFARGLLKGAKERLGWQVKSGEDELTKQLRGMIIGALGTLANDEPTQKEAREWYAKYKQDKQCLDPNIPPALVSILAHCGDKTIYEEFVREFHNAKTPQEETRYLFALAGFRDRSLIEQTLDKTISGEVRTQNAPYLVQSVLYSVVGRELAWDFLKKNWEKLNQLFPENSIPRMCEGVTALVVPQLQADVKGFFEKHKVKQGGKTIDQHLERLDVALAFKGRESKTFTICFAK